MAWARSTLWSLLACSALLLASSPAAAQSSKGFTLERYEPTAAGQWAFWVDHPQYSEELQLHAGATFDYGHNPLVLGVVQSGNFVEKKAIVARQLYGHVDVAATLANSLELTIELPVAIYQDGNPGLGLSPAGTAVGDPRLGAMLRLLGDPMRDAFSVQGGVRLWIPVQGNSNLVGDGFMRLAPRGVLAGVIDRVMWSFVTELVYREQASAGSLPAGAGNSVGTELRFGGGVQYADAKKRYAIGPEAMLATVILGGSAFGSDYTSLEVLFGGQYKLAHTWLIGLAAGVGALQEPGTPDSRMIARFAYAPEEAEKAAPPVRKAAPPPPPDRDHDGVLDADDLCPDVHHGPISDPKRSGCPRLDRDRDGVFDDEDACVDTAGLHTREPETNGCPVHDRDADGVLDDVDVCPDTPKGEHPDAAREGCPRVDTDGDGVYDDEDQCMDEPSGKKPHPTKLGCPTVIDNAIVVDPIFFKTNKAEILPVSVPVLQSVADVLEQNPEITKVSIEGHTDNQGKASQNLHLSRRRARAVMSWLIKHGISAERLESQGYGQTRPITTNDTEEGRAKNRRVAFVIVGR